MELDILNLLGRGISYSSIERVRLRSSILCGLMLTTGPIVPDSSFEPALEPEKVRCRSIPGKVSEVKNPSPCVCYSRIVSVMFLLLFCLCDNLCLLII